MACEYREPINLGTAELVTINQLVDMVAEAAAKSITKRHNILGPQGVRGRNSDRTRLREVLGWEPSITLKDGLSRTYPWIQADLQKTDQRRLAAAA